MPSWTPLVSPSVISIRWSEVPYSQFLDQLESGEIVDVQLTDDRIIYTCCNSEEKDEKVYNVVRVDDPDIISRLDEANVSFSAEAAWILS